MEVPSQYSNALKLYRRRIGYTQQQVAQLLGHKTVSRLSHYENGDTVPPLLTALQLEVVYRVPVAFLFPKIYDELRREIRTREEASPMPIQQALF